jgi:hypothetical protein
MPSPFRRGGIEIKILPTSNVCQFNGKFTYEYLDKTPKSLQKDLLRKSNTIVELVFVALLEGQGQVMKMDISFVL